MVTSHLRSLFLLTEANKGKTNNSFNFIEFMCSITSVHFYTQHLEVIKRMLKISFAIIIAAYCCIAAVQGAAIDAEDRCPFVRKLLIIFKNLNIICIL
jgi:hypothetical protein